MLMSILRSVKFAFLCKSLFVDKLLFAQADHSNGVNSKAPKSMR